MPGNKARRNARSSRATHKTQLGVFRAFREARVSVFADKNEASFAGLVVLAGEFHPIPFRTRPLKPPAPMVLRLKPRESRSLPVQPRTLRLDIRTCSRMLRRCEHAPACFAITPPHNLLFSKTRLQLSRSYAQSDYHALLLALMLRPGALRRVRIHVEVDVVHTPMVARMTAACVPRPVAHLDTVHLGHLEAAPLATFWQHAICLTSELVAEQHLLALGDAEDVRAHLPP